MESKRSVNLCSVYMLPLLGLNRWSFGENNFVNSYVNEDNTHLLVEIKTITTLITSHPKFRFEYRTEDGKLMAVFEVSPEHRKTVELFREGKYSQFSDVSKTIIRKKSGLRYKAVQADGTIKSARELLALDKDKELRKVMEKELNVKIPENAELASIPGDENFFKLNLKKTIELDKTT